MGPEIMSYGGGSGEPYGVQEVQGASLEKPPKVVSDSPTGGLQSLTAMRWGKGEGCQFTFGSVLGWSAPGEPFGAGYQPYVCDGFEKEVFGCTYDNRMSAACTVETYDTQYPPGLRFRSPWTCSGGCSSSSRRG